MSISGFYFGADYYPEHWPEKRWEEDARLMAAAGINVVRLAEFAWSLLEPEEGHFDFAWLDQAIAVLSGQGIDVVLGTPTASPPPWLMSKGEDLFILNEDGRRLTYGLRREYCPNNPLYHHYTERIVSEMALHYADHPAVIGWQIDNEFGDRCYCEICRTAFHRWLRARYRDLAALNEKWGTIFWSHVYTEWSQIPAPLTNARSHNPGLALDYKRFMSDTYRTYQKSQIDLIRKNDDGRFITHNLMGFGYNQLNYYDNAADLDFVSWDNYMRTQWNMRAAVDPSSSALSADTMRGLKKRNFWVMEQQSGGGGWEMVAVPPQPGELRLWTYQAIAHGAEAIVYFRWRTCRSGTEQYWHGILDHHGIPGRRYDEVVQVGQELKKAGGIIAGSQIRSQVAIMQSYDTRFAFQVQPNNPRFSYEGHIHDIYRALHSQNISVDIVSEKDTLQGYKAVIVPAMYVLPQETAENLQAFADNGGLVAFTPRTGVKDVDNKVVNMKLPGLVAKMIGAEVEDYVSMPVDSDAAVQFDLPGLEEEFTAYVWADLLQPTEAQVIARYSADYFAGKPAATLNTYGEGTVIYLGTLGDDHYYTAVMRKILDLCRIKPVLEAPAGVEVCERWNDDQRLLFILNHTREVQRIKLDGHYTDLLSGQTVDDEYAVEATGIALLGT